MPNQNVFMQVIVKDSLDENKRVARYPKQNKDTASNAQFSNNFETTSKPRDFMQLIYDDSLVKGKSASPKINLHSVPSSHPLEVHDNEVIKTKFKSFNGNSYDTNRHDNKFDHATKYSFHENIPENKETPSSLILNDLLVQNDPESFKRSIVENCSKSGRDFSEIVPHPRGGPDSYDVFKFNFDDQLPNRPSFTLHPPENSPIHDKRKNFHAPPLITRPVSIYGTSTVPSVESNNIFQEQRYHKVKQDNNVWEQFTKASNPKKSRPSKKERRKINFQETLVPIKTSLKAFRLPSTHPLRSILPKTAKIVGIQSIRRNNLWSHGVNRHDRRPHIMTVEYFLKRYPNMNKIRGAIPVPISDAKHIRMIELLASQPTGNSLKSRYAFNDNQIRSTLHPKRQIPSIQIPSISNTAFNKTQEQSRSTIHSKERDKNLDDMLKELEILIAERAEKRVIHFRPLKSSSSSYTKFITPQENHILSIDIQKDNHLNHLPLKDHQKYSADPVVPIRPRGEGPSLRFTSTSQPTESSLAYDIPKETIRTTQSIQATSPKPFTKQNQFELSPKLEFGFKPITTSSSFSFTTPALSVINDTSSFHLKHNPIQHSLPIPMKSSDPYQTMFDAVNEIIQTNNLQYPTRYPRLIPSAYANSGKQKTLFKSSFSSDKSVGAPLVLDSLNTISDPFFFTTTTTKPPSQNDVDLSFNPTSGISSTLFDMRKFFFIPNKSKSTKTNLITGSSLQKSGNRRAWRKPPRRKFFPRIKRIGPRISL